MDEAPDSGERWKLGKLPRQARLTVALGNAQRELVVLAALDEWEEFGTEVCVHATDLLSRVRAGASEAILLSSELPGLGAEEAAELARSPAGASTVLLVADPGASRWTTLGIPIVLRLDAPLDEIRAALADVRQADGRVERPARAATTTQFATPAKPARISPPHLSHTTIAVASGAGSPGRSTVALGLAAALGAVAPTVLVDADLAGPSVAALLDANPRRNLFQVAYKRPSTPEGWTEALADELQPLGPRSPHGRMLCGLASAAMRGGVSPHFLGDLLGELRSRFQHVILDLGADMASTDAALHRAALALADQILLVTTPDIADLLRAQVALGYLERHLDVERERVALIVNRYDRRHHPGRREIEWGLGMAVAALVPYDHAAIERAKRAYRPIVLDGRSRAGRALLELAGRAHGGSIDRPPEVAGTRWWRLLDSPFRHPTRQSHVTVPRRALSGGQAPAARATRKSAIGREGDGNGD